MTDHLTSLFRYSLSGWLGGPLSGLLYGPPHKGFRFDPSLWPTYNFGTEANADWHSHIIIQNLLCRILYVFRCHPLLIFLTIFLETYSIHDPFSDIYRFFLLQHSFQHNLLLCVTQSSGLNASSNFFFPSEPLGKRLPLSDLSPLSHSSLY